MQLLKKAKRLLALCTLIGISQTVSAQNEDLYIHGNLWASGAIGTGPIQASWFNQLDPSALKLVSGHSDLSSLYLTDQSHRILGGLHASYANGIGLLDKNSNWAIRIQTDSYIQFSLGAQTRLHIDADQSLDYHSAHPTATRLNLRDQEGSHYGALYGAGDGTEFGLLDGAGNWSYATKKNLYTWLKVNDRLIMALNQDGKVGIGTSTPEKTLHVAGDAKFDGTISVAPGGDISMGSFTQTGQ